MELNNQQADAIAASSQPRRGFLQGHKLLAALAILGLLSMLFRSPPLLNWLVPLSVAALVTIGSWTLIRRQRAASSQLAAGLTALQLRDYPRAQQLLIASMSRPVYNPVQRTGGLLALAMVAEHQRCYEPALRLYESVLSSPRCQWSQYHLAAVAKALSLLRLDRLTDAVDYIAQLEKTSLPPPSRAMLSMVQLYRQIRTGQSAVALENYDQIAAQARDHLGTGAAPIYGLLALAHDRQSDQAGARLWWLRATMLLRGAELVHYFEELQPLTQKWPDMQVPKR